MKSIEVSYDRNHQFAAWINAGTPRQIFISKCGLGIRIYLNDVTDQEWPKYKAVLAKHGSDAVYVNADYLQVQKIMEWFAE